MKSQVPALLHFPDPFEVRYILARAAYESIVSSVRSAAIGRNPAGSSLLELVENDNRLEVFQQGLIFPCLTLSFNPTTAEITYKTAARNLGFTPELGVIIPGYAGNVLLVDKHGVAHRSTTHDLVMVLLAPATADTHGLQRAA